MEYSSEWELCKENIQPLRKGRNMASLQPALQSRPTDNDSHYLQMQQQKRDFEWAIRTYSGEDPLSPWCSYIEWTEQNFPKGGKEGNLIKLLENCVIAFKDSPHYKNDPRYVGICLTLAGITTDAPEFYEYMFNERIGSKLASFYISWAAFLEGLGNFKKADAVFLHGQSANAEPKDELLGSHKLFLARMLSSDERTGNENGEWQTEESERVALGALKGFGKKQLVGSMRTGAVQLYCNTGIRAQAADSRPSQKAIQVYSDENEKPVVGPSSLSPGKLAFPSSSIAKKENERKPGKWTNNKMTSLVTPVPPSRPAIEVHTEEWTATQNPQTLSSDQGLHYGSSKSGLNNVMRRIQLPLQNENCPKLFKFCFDKLYCGVTEVQFEELRAAAFLKKRKKEKDEKQLEEREARIREREEELKRKEKLFAQHKELLPSNKVTNENFSQTLDVRAAEAALVQPKPKNAEISESTVTSSPGSTESDTKQSKPADEGCRSPIRKPLHLLSVDGRLKEKSAVDRRVEEKSAINRHLEEKPTDDGRLEEKLDLKNHTIHFMKALWHDDSSVALAKPFPLVENKLQNKTEIPIVNKMPFKIYDAEEREKEQPLVQLEGFGKTELETDENKCPKDYVQVHSARKLTGILVPSVDIPFEPLQKPSDLELIENDNLDGIQPLAEQAISDYSINCPSSATFVSDLKVFSTPTVSLKRREHDDALTDIVENFSNARMGFPAFSAEHKPTGIAQKPTLLLAHKPDLSAISETSREYKSSSSSGASSAAISHFKSQTSRSKTHEDATTTTPGHCSRFAFEQRTPLLAAKFVDPFSDSVKTSLLCSAHLESNEAFLAFRKPMPVFARGARLNLGCDEYILTSEVATGGYGVVYLAHSCRKDSAQECKPFALKVQTSLNSSWEFYIATELRSRLIKLEKENSKYNISVRPSIMHIKKFYEFDAGGILQTDYIPGGTLLNLVNTFTIKRLSLSECYVLFFTIELLRIVERIHACGIIHADIKPDNLMLLNLPHQPSWQIGLSFAEAFGLETQSLLLIDYGNSIDTTLFPPKTAFMAQLKTQMFECHEMKDGKPWTYQTDFYGVAACAHVMLFGSYMKTLKRDGKWRITTTIKRYWCHAEWTHFFDALLNIPDCNHQPNISHLIESLEKCLLSKRMIEEFSSQYTRLLDHFSKSALF